MERLAVLYAEDNAHDSELTRRYLRRMAPHIDLQAVSTAHECLKRLENETFDAVLLDYRLPDRDGLELLREIRNRSLPVAVIMLTGSGDPETAAAALKDGAYDYLVKQSDYLMRLPATVEKAVALARSAFETRERIRVLYAEHTSADIELTLRHCRLRAPHFEFTVVTTGREALAQLDREHYDLVLLDYKMPEMDGVAVVHEIRARQLTVPAVVITGQGDEAGAVAALKAGAYDYIVKREDYLYRLPFALEHALTRFRLAEEKAILERRVEERTRELKQASQRLAALATVAARIQRRLNLVDLFTALSVELRGLAWESAIALEQEEVGVLEIVHISLTPEALVQMQAFAPTARFMRLHYKTHVGLQTLFERRASLYLDHPLAAFIDVMQDASAAGSTDGVDVAAVGAVVGIHANTRAVAAPLVTEGGLLGLLVVWGNDLYESDVPAVTAFAGQMAVAIENARLHQRLHARRVEEQAALLRLSEGLLGLLLPQDVMARAAMVAAQALSVPFAGVFLPVEAGVALALRAADGSAAAGLTEIYLTAAGGTPEAQALVTHASVCGQVAESVEPLRELGLWPGLAVPLVVGADVLGVLSVRATWPRLFDEDDTRLLTLIAGQTAVALERARLYVTEQHRAAQLAVIGEVGRELMAVLDPDHLLLTVVSLVQSRFRYSHVSVLLTDDVGERLLLRASAPVVTAEAIQEIRIGVEGVTGRAAADGRPYLANDVARDPYFKFDPGKPLTRAELSVPILARARLVGMLDVQSTTVNAFGPEDVFVLQALAQQVAVALENARLYVEVRRRAEEVSTLLTTVAAISTPLNLEVRLEAIAHHARQLVAAETCTVYRVVAGVDGTGQILQPLVSLGARDEARAARVLVVGVGLVGRVAAMRLGESARVEDWEDDGPAWVVAVPLLFEESLLGVMVVARRGAGEPFTLHDFDLLSSFATQSALALQNAELVERLRQRAQSLQAAYDQLAEADKLKDELVQNISHELRTPLTFVKGYIDLLLDGQLGPISAEQSDGLRVVTAKADSIIRLVDDVITLQSLHAVGLERERHDLGVLALRAIGMASVSAAHAHVRLDCVRAREPVVVAVDATRFLQVLDSLLSNAIKFSPNGGDVIVRVSATPKDAIIEVIDHGVGIPAPKLPRIFDRFYQGDGSTTRRFGGVGLGLAIVKQIVDMHAGRVEVESQMGVGSTFRVCLPR